MSLDTRNPRRLPAHRRRELGLALADLELQLLRDRRYCLVQSALAIPNEAGASFRADNNTALQANATFQAGASAPGTTYADQYWWDTTNNVLKKRNQANSAWILASTFGTRDEAFVVSRSSNTILGLSDIGKTFVATSTFTQTLTAAATLGDGWYVFYRNDGAGVITIDPNASETIDGATTIVLGPGDACRIACNGTLFKTQALVRNVQLGTGTGTAALGGQANVDVGSHANSGLGDTTFSSYSLPANSLSANGKLIRITAAGTKANNANAKQVRIHFGAGAVSTVLPASNSISWMVIAYIVKTGSNAQLLYVNESDQAAGASQLIRAASSETDSAAITITSSGQGGASSDITQELFLVEFMN